MEIKILKLTSGEEIISQCLLKEGKYTLKNPQKFMLTQEGIGSMPMMPFSSNEVYEIDEKHVVFTCEPELEIRNVYNSKYGTGVVLPTSKIQLA